MHSREDCHKGGDANGGDSFRFTILLGLLNTIGPFTMDLYVPALPNIANDLETSAHLLQISFSGSLVGFALGQFFIGPWSDSVGRKLPIALSAAVHLASSFLGGYASFVGVLIIARFLMGVAAAASGVAAMAIVRDKFSGLPLVRTLSNMALVSGLAPIVAPIIGTQLLTLVGWRGIFFSLGAYAMLIGLVALMLLPETRPVADRVKGGFAEVTKRIKSMVGDLPFVGFILISGMLWGGYFAYLTVSTYVLRQHFGLTDQEFALAYLVPGFAYIVGSQSSPWLLRRIRPSALITAAVAWQCVSGAVLLIWGESVGLFLLLVLVACIICAVGLATPAIQSSVLTPYGEFAGTAAALNGMAGFGIAGIVISIQGAVGALSVRGYGGLLLALTLLSAISVVVLIRPWQKR